MPWKTKSVFLLSFEPSSINFAKLTTARYRLSAAANFSYKKGKWPPTQPTLGTTHMFRGSPILEGWFGHALRALGTHLRLLRGDNSHPQIGT